MWTWKKISGESEDGPPMTSQVADVSVIDNRGFNRRHVMIPNSGFREGVVVGGASRQQSEKDFVDFMVDEGQRGTFF